MRAAVNKPAKWALRLFISFVSLLLLISLVLAISGLPGDTTADHVLGQGVFDSGAAGLGAGMSQPLAAAVDRSVTPNHLYVADFGNNRVLGWNDITSLVNGGAADLVIGQPDSSSSECNTGGVGPASLCGAAGVAVDSLGNLYVADKSNNRVLEYTAPFTNDTVADMVFGQGGSFSSISPNSGGLGPDSLASPTAVGIDDAGNLYAADSGNNRVLEFDSPLSTNTTADRVFGQGGSFFTNFLNEGGLGPDSLSSPSAVTLDGAGDLYVADTGNNRVLEFNSPLSTDVTADLVFGQAGSFFSNDANHGGLSASSLFAPSGLSLDGAGNLYIADSGNHRVLTFHSPLSTDTTAEIVFGQGGGFFSNDANHGGIGADSLSSPSGGDFDISGNFYLADSGNNRLLEYNQPFPTAIPSQTASPSPKPTPTLTASPNPTPSPIPTVGPAHSITLENSKPGTSDWLLTNHALNHEIEGYASRTSVNRGDQISFFVNTTDTTYTLEVFRVGWYGGLGARRMTSPILLTGSPQPVPTPDPTTGLFECAWSRAYVLTIATPSDPSDWISGVYLVKLTGQQSLKQNYIVFDVRDDVKHSDLLLQNSVTTYQAYNGWGGKSLYGTVTNVQDLPNRAYKVSFNRPYDGGVPIDFFRWEYPMIRFLERECYDVTYSTDIDTHANGAAILNHRGFLSVGHDEYWSYEMRANVTAARDQGVSLGFFSSDDSAWQIRLEPAANGDPNRTEVCYKTGARLPDGSLVPASLDPVSSDPATYYLLTTLWKSPHVTLPGNPEERFIGEMHIGGGSGDIVVTNASHWVFAQSGLQDGDHLTSLLGNEMDGMQGSSPVGTVRLAHSPFVQNGVTTYADMTIYSAASGAVVFAAGTFQWGWGLDDDHQVGPAVASRAVQQVTRNILSRFINPPPVLAFPDTAIDFGSRAVGETAVQTITVTSNQSTTTSLATAISGANSGDFSITGGTCTASVAANSKCTILVGFTPTAVGSRSATLTITDSPDPGSPRSISLTGIGLLPVSVLPSSITFNSQVVGTDSAPRTITIINNQSTAVSLSKLTSGANPGDFTIAGGTCTASLAANSQCTILVSLAPTAAGSRVATLTITGSPDPNGPYAISLTGWALSAVKITPVSVWYGTGTLGSSTTVSVTVTNNQSTAVSLAKAISGANSADFAITGGTCAAILAAKSQCTIVVSFAPTATGSRAATLTVSDSPDSSSPHAIPLGGNAVQPVSVSPISAITFNSQVLGTASTPHAITIVNNQSTALNLSKVISGANPADFNIGGSCGSSVVANSRCTILISFAPTAIGSRAATLTIIDSPDPGSPHVIPLGGNALQPVSVSPSSITFNSQVVGTTSAPRTITIINNQSVALNLSKVISGANPADFNIGGSCGASVAANSQCTILVSFAPTATANRAATLTITDSPDSHGPYVISLSGWALAPVRISPPSVWYGTQKVGSATTVTVTVSNNQTVAVSLSKAISGTSSGDFVITGGTCAATLAGGSQCTVLVSFAPTATGSLAATLTVTDRPDSNSPHAIPLGGNGSK